MQIHRITLQGTQYFLSGDRLSVVHAGDRVFDVSLSPVFDGNKVQLSSWRQTAENRFETSLGEYGAAFLEARHGRLAYWIETPIEQFENATYLSDGRISGSKWRTFVSDEHEREWDVDIDTNIPISSAYAESSSPDGSSQGGMTDPDDTPTHWIWNVHVRAFAMAGLERWLGISIPGPWGVGVTRLNMHKCRFNLRFEVLRPGCTEGKMPVVYFCPNLADPFDVLDEYRELSEALGLMNLAPKQPPDWWVNPWYGYYDEMERQMHAGTISRESANVIDLIRAWVAKAQETCDRRDFNINLEQGCYRLYGDYRPAEILGSEREVRQIVDRWRTEGIHVGHYLHPYVVNTKVPFYAKCPEAFCKPKREDFFMEYPLEPWDNDNPQFAPIDWTHPEGRAFMLGWVEYLVSSAPECMNYDVIRSNHWRSPDPREYDFHDPDWGIGDMMTYKVQKLIYEKAKSVKPECMVTKVAALDCYMQPTFDAMQIAEDWTHNMQHWYRRAQIAYRVQKNTLIWFDPWFCTRTKWNEYFMSMMAVAMPETQAVEHTTHPYYPSWRKLEQKHFRRRKAGMNVFFNSPVEPADESRVRWSPDHFEAHRLKRTGRLAGWYGALALGPKTVVSYNERQALLASSENRVVTVPLPPGAELLKVTCLLHDGKQKQCDYNAAGGGNVRLYVSDCGQDVLNYCIRYNLEG